MFTRPGILGAAWGHGVQWSQCRCWAALGMSLRIWKLCMECWFIRLTSQRKTHRRASKWWCPGGGGRTRTLALDTTGSVSLFHCAKPRPSTLLLFCLGHNSPSGHNIVFDFKCSWKTQWSYYFPKSYKYLAWNSGFTTRNTWDVCWKCRHPGLTLDLLNENLYFNKCSRRLKWTTKFRNQWTP